MEKDKSKVKKLETVEELENWREYYFKKWNQTKREVYKKKLKEFENRVLFLLPGFKYTEDGVLVEDKNSNDVFRGMLSQIRGHEVKYDPRRSGKLKETINIVRMGAGQKPLEEVLTDASTSIKKLGVSAKDAAEGFAKGIKKFREAVAKTNVDVNVKDLENIGRKISRKEALKISKQTMEDAEKERREIDGTG